MELRPRLFISILISVLVIAIRPSTTEGRICDERNKAEKLTNEIEKEFSLSINKECFLFRQFTIPYEADLPPPRRPYDSLAWKKLVKELSPKLAPRFTEAESLLRVWFVGKKISDFSEFFDDQKRKEEAADLLHREFLWSYMNDALRGQIRSDAEVSHLKTITENTVRQLRAGRKIEPRENGRYVARFGHFSPQKRLEIMKRYANLQWNNVAFPFVWTIELHTQDDSIVSTNVRVGGL